MRGDLKWKIPVIIILIGVSVWLLLPSTIFQITTKTLEDFRKQGISEETVVRLEDLKNKEFTSEKAYVAALEQAGIPQEQIPTIVSQTTIRQNAINLGLDLQGGVHLVLEVDVEKYVEQELVRLKDFLSQDLKKAGIPFTAMSVDGGNRLKIAAARPDELKKIDDYLGKEVTSLEKKSESSGNENILVVGFKPEVAERWEENALDQALLTIRNRIDEFGLREPIIQRQGRSRIIVELAGERDPERAIKLLQEVAELRFQLVKDFAPTKEALLSQHNNTIPAGYQVLPGVTAEDAAEPSGYYLLEKEVKVTGANLEDARVSSDEMGLPAVSFELDRIGARAFSALTEANIGSPLAIVLDDIVQTAPVIRSRIPDGQGQITGVGTYEEAENTSIVLRAGALPAPVKILENISVGPTLGEDSIRAGSRAMIIGGMLVVIFMLIYYKTAGVIADIALGFNMLFILAILAYSKATLTLPGLAGLVLTLGMAVDNNILIFERIKEELRIGKTFRSAADNGFRRALVTIVDANLTTLLAAVILFQFGTGAIRGFAVTLSIGILSTLFTVLVLSKVIFDLILQNRNVKRLSI